MSAVNAAGAPVIKIDISTKYQTSYGFGYTLTCGSEVRLWV